MLLFITIFCIIINLPMGAWRSTLKKFSIGWFIAIHAPVPLVIFIRILTQSPIKYAPIFVLASVLGQYIGGKLGEKYRKNRSL